MTVGQNSEGEITKTNSNHRPRRQPRGGTASAVTEGEIQQTKRTIPVCHKSAAITTRIQPDTLRFLSENAVFL